MPVPPSANLSHATLVQTLHNQFCSTVAGNEINGCVLTSESGFLVRADALRAAQWLPTYSEATGLALGKELLQRGALLAQAESHGAQIFH